MATKFKEDYIGDFGIPDKQIEPSISKEYDPYKGIDIVLPGMAFTTQTTIPDFYYPKWFIVPQELRDHIIASVNAQGGSITIDDTAYFSTYGDTPSQFCKALGFSDVDYYIADYINPPLGDPPQSIRISYYYDNTKPQSWNILYEGSDGSIFPFPYTQYPYIRELHCKSGDGSQINNEVIFNSSEFYEYDEDKRPSLGLYNLTNDNITQDDFTQNISNDLFNQITKNNLITNGDSRFISVPYYKIGALGGKSFHPQGGWGYVTKDGIGINITQGNTPGNHVEDPEHEMQEGTNVEVVEEFSGGQRFPDEHNTSETFFTNPDSHPGGESVELPNPGYRVSDYLSVLSGDIEEIKIKKIEIQHYQPYETFAEDMSTLEGLVEDLIFGRVNGIKFGTVDYNITNGELNTIGGVRLMKEDYPNLDFLNPNGTGYAIAVGTDEIPYSTLATEENGGLVNGVLDDEYWNATQDTGGHTSLVTVFDSATDGDLTINPDLITADGLPFTMDVYRSMPNHDFKLKITFEYTGTSGVEFEYPNGSRAKKFIQHPDFTGAPIDEDANYFSTQGYVLISEYINPPGMVMFTNNEFTDISGLVSAAQINVDEYGEPVDSDELYNYFNNNFTFEGNTFISVTEACANIYGGDGDILNGDYEFQLSPLDFFPTITDPSNGIVYQIFPCNKKTYDSVDIRSDFGYAGYLPYILATDESLELDINWARWVKDSECFSYGRCLEFEADDTWDDLNTLAGEIEQSSVDIGSYDSCQFRKKVTEDEYGYDEWSFYGDTCSGGEICVSDSYTNINSVRLAGESGNTGGYSTGQIKLFGSGNCINKGSYSSAWTAYGDPNQSCHSYDSDYNDYYMQAHHCDSTHHYCYGNTGGGYRCYGNDYPPGTTISEEEGDVYVDLLKLGDAKNNEYRTLNQFQNIYSADEDTLVPYSSLKISFMMKTLESNYDDMNKMPIVESCIIPGSGGVFGSVIESFQNLNSNVFNKDLKSDYAYIYDGYWDNNYLDNQANYNSLTQKLSNNSFSLLGSVGRFSNTTLNKWEHFEYTFNLTKQYYDEINDRVKDLSFIIQTSAVNNNDGFRGKVLIDNIKVMESYDFTPDVDVRKKKGPNDYGNGDLTKYYDPTIPEQLEAYNDTTAPMEAQFYFYPRYHYEDIFFSSKSIIHNDFRQGMFYLYNVNWGDGSVNEFVSEPKRLDENTSVYHTYKSSGIFEITGTMIRMKPNKDYEPVGVIHNENFVLRININEKLDEDFPYLNSDGFSFIPYKNTTPVIGGVSEQSLYYKTIKRQLGILEDGTDLNTDFESVGDRLKTEVALNKITNEFDENLKLLNEFKKIRLSSKNNNTSDIVFNGYKNLGNELGKSIGDVDLTEIRYFDKPMQIWEMFGFKDEDLDDIAKPDNPRYWKNIIPHDYNIFNRSDLFYEQPGIINTFAEQDWIDINEDLGFGHKYYYPVLPKYDKNGDFLQSIYPNDKIPFAGNAFDEDSSNTLITDSNHSNQNLRISINSNNVDSGVFDDNSGNKNYGFVFNDYKPKFNKESLKPEKTKFVKPIKFSKSKGAF